MSVLLPFSLFFLAIFFLQREVQALTKLMGWEFTQHHSPEATHIITKSRRASRTLKFLSGILNGAWIVTLDWVHECRKKEVHVPEARFEIEEDDMDNFGGAKRGRENRLARVRRSFIWLLHLSLLLKFFFAVCLFACFL